ncbi:ankyrin repeat domain-containing protein 50-like isoform X2 [Schistocerca gregaria]|uniref:ankyrin repeat domain-containing protein 50-like isoform X2 n=1 Tax=Schistocerca gregaria TaxID=7010 RepID=UPI00211ED744|nr:ankyrin repeat domain-containing protein 50-like isoform X2 [Schistocerca gregaria]
MIANVKKISHVDLIRYNMRTKVSSLNTSKETDTVSHDLPRILSLEDQPSEKRKEHRRDIHVNICREFFSDMSNALKCCVQNYWLASEEVVLMDIHTAASLGDCGGIDAALERGENINFCSHLSGWTPLMFAASRNHVVAVKHLIVKGANVCTHSTEDGRTAFALAVSGGSRETVAAIADETLRQNLGLDSWDFYGWTPLMHAVYFGTPDIVKMLVENGCNVNVADITGKTPLIVAIECSREDMVFTLLNSGANPTSKTKKGRTAVDYAEVYNGYPGIVNMVQAAAEFRSKLKNASLRTVILILAGLDLRKYIPTFIEHNIDVNKFNQLTEDDLRDLGLTTMGPRKKVLSAVRDRLTEIL